MSNYKEYLKDLVRNGKVRDALVLVMNIYKNNNNKESEKECIALYTLYNKYELEKRLTLVNTNSDAVYVRVVLGTCDYINELPENENILIPESYNIDNMDDSNNIININNADNKDIGLIEQNENIKILNLITKNEFNFYNWYKSSRIAMIIGGIAIVSFFISIIFVGIGLVNADISKFEYLLIRIVSFMHFFVIISYIIYNIYANFKNNKIKKIEKILEKQNKNENIKINKYIKSSINATSELIIFWNMSLFGWLILYLFFILDKSKNILNNINQNFKDLIFNVLTDISSLSLLVCFSILSFRIKGSKQHYFNPISVSGLFILILFIFTEYFSIYKNFESINLYSKIFTGIFGCITISLLTSRLTSIFIEAPIGFILVLYTYAGIQILVPFFDFEIYYYRDPIHNISFENLLKYKNLYVNNFSKIQKSLEIFSLFFSLFAKCILSLIIIWLYEGGKLILYFIRSNSIEDKSKSLVINEI